MFRGFEIVLTGDEGLVSTYSKSHYLGFASGLPMDIFPSFFDKLLFPTASGEHGRMKTSQYGLCKIEASLLDNGFSRENVAIVDPRRLDEAVGPNTRAVGIGVLDPLGINYGTMLLRYVLRLMGINARFQSYMSWATMRILGHPVIKKHRSRLKVIVGGQGVWEIIDSGLRARLGIDTLVEGEGELVAPSIFAKAIKGEELVPYVKGPPVPVEKIPIIRTPSRGIVEITRGCGRGCRFCNPTLLMYRNIPMEKIIREIEVNVAGGEKKILLHSEDFLRYGSSDIYPRRDKLLNLINTVRRMPGVEDVTFDFVTPSTVMTEPKLVKEASELIGNNSFRIIEIGIESASPRVISMIAPGKPRPFSPDDWPDVVEKAVNVLNDAGWWICATIIVGLPGETPEDVDKNLRLVERLEPHDVFIFPLPFVPSGSLRKKKKLGVEDILPRGYENLTLIFVAVYDAIKKLRKLSWRLVESAPKPLIPILGGLLYFASTVGLRRLQRANFEGVLESTTVQYNKIMSRSA